MAIQKTLFGVQYSQETIDKVREYADQQADMDYYHSSYILNCIADKMEAGDVLTREEQFELELMG